MKNYYSYNPVKFLFGRGMLSNIETELKSYKKILLVFGKDSIKKNSCYQQIKKALSKKQLFEFSGIEPNPEIKQAELAVEFAREKKIEFIVAAGGGSVIDFAKFISLAYFSKNKNLWSLIDFKTKPPSNFLPFGCIQTCPGSGTESNNALVLSNIKLKKKETYYNLNLYPKFSVLDPEFTLDLPFDKTCTGITDMFIHVLEQYLTYPVGETLQDRQAEALLLTILECTPKLLDDLKNYEYRATIMWCGASAVNGLINRGMPVDWSTHYIGNILTILYNITHAHALVLVFKQLLLYKMNKKKEKICQLGIRVFGLNGKEKHVAKETIKRITDFLKKMNPKMSLYDYGLQPRKVSEEVINLLENQDFQKIGENKDISIIDIKKIIMRC